jgi:methylated-DNA-[protein]-cysteine S-methyltransferase
MESSTDGVVAAETGQAEAIFDTPVGPLIARANDEGLSELLFVRRGRQASSEGGDPSARRYIRAIELQLSEYFDGKRKTFDVPLRLQGPPFHMRVWKELLGIPYGETISYGELAKRVGDPTTARAVGAANGANPIVIVIPCHRVIGTSGKLVGYGGGLWRKRTLLDLECGRLALVKV